MAIQWWAFWQLIQNSWCWIIKPTDIIWNIHFFKMKNISHFLWFCLFVYLYIYFQYFSIFIIIRMCLMFNWTITLWWLQWSMGYIQSLSHVLLFIYNLRLGCNDLMKSRLCTGLNSTLRCSLIEKLICSILIFCSILFCWELLIDRCVW